jgi:hypothetical protein
MTDNKMTVKKMTVNKMTVNKMTVNKMIVNKMTRQDHYINDDNRKKDMVTFGQTNF